MAQRSIRFALLALAVLASYAIAASVERSSPEEVPQAEEEILTIHKVGRRQIPVRVTVNHNDATVLSVPITSDRRHQFAHHELETFYDFQAGIAIYRAEDDKTCFIEELPRDGSFTFEEVFRAINEQALHRVFVRQAPRTLYAVNLTEPLLSGEERIRERCGGRQIQLLVDQTPVEETENALSEIEEQDSYDVPARSRRSPNDYFRRRDDYFRQQQQQQPTSSSAWARATLDSAEAKVEGNGFAQAYSQVGDDTYRPSRRLEATSSTSNRHLTRSGDQQFQQRAAPQQQAPAFQQSQEKAGSPQFPFMTAPAFLTSPNKGFAPPPPSTKSASTSSFSASSSFSSSSMLGSADLQALFGAPAGNQKGPSFPSLPRTPSWTGPIPIDAEVTQQPGSSYKTYTWKVTDASGYTTTHWYSGPLGPDRVPTTIQPSFNINPELPEGFGRRKPFTPSWTGPIPADAEVTQAAGSQYKTYTWKVTDANGYTTTHWYSGPLNPDRTPVAFSRDTDTFFPEQPSLPSGQRRVASESRVIQQQSITQQRTKGQQTVPQPAPQPGQRFVGNRNELASHQRQQEVIRQQQSPIKAQPVAPTPQQLQQQLIYQQQQRRQQTIKAQAPARPEPVPVQPQQPAHAPAVEEQYFRQQQYVQQTSGRQPAAPVRQPEPAVEEQHYSRHQQQQYIQQTTGRQPAVPVRQPEPVPSVEEQYIRHQQQQYHQQTSGRQPSAPARQPEPAVDGQYIRHHQQQQFTQETTGRRPSRPEPAQPQEVPTPGTQTVEEQHSYVRQEQRFDGRRPEPAPLAPVLHHQQEEHQEVTRHEEEEEDRVRYQLRHEQQQVVEEQEETQHHTDESHHVMEESTMLHIMEQHNEEQQRLEQEQELRRREEERDRLYQEQLREYEERIRQQQAEQEERRRQQMIIQQTQETTVHEQVGQEVETSAGHREVQEERHHREEHWTVGSESGARRPLPVPSGPNQIVTEHTSHQQVIATNAGEGRNGHGVVVQPGDRVPGAPEYSVPGGFRGRVIGVQQEEETRVTATNGGRNGKPFTPSGRADIPIEHDDEPLAPILEPEQQPEEPAAPLAPAPEPDYAPAPEVDSVQNAPEPEEYEDTDQIICGDDGQQSQDYGVSECGPSMTATSSIFESQVSMISVPIPAVIDHMASTGLSTGSVSGQSSSFVNQQARVPAPVQQVPQRVSGSSGTKTVSSSSYSKTIITSGVVPVQPDQLVSPPASQVLPSKSSETSECQSSSFTYRCQMVYGPTKRTKICEPVEIAIPCCAIC